MPLASEGSDWGQFLQLLMLIKQLKNQQQNLTCLHGTRKGHLCPQQAVCRVYTASCAMT